MTSLGREIKKYLPQTLLGRSILIFIIPILLLQTFTVYMFFDRHLSRMTARLSYAVAGEVAVLADIIEHAPDRDRTLTDVLNYTAGNLDMMATFHPGETVLPATIPAASYWQKIGLDSLSDAMREQVHRPFSLRLDPHENYIEIDIKLNDGVLTVQAHRRRLYSSSSYIFLLWMGGTSLLLSVVALLFMRNQIRPIRKLAIAADRFGRGQDLESFKPEGAREVRQAARAFIDMRDRIRRQVEQRTAMLAGVSHDLRTPITRLKLGLSLMPDNADVAALKSDVETMEMMLNAYLDFVRGEGDERVTSTNISTLIHQIISNEQRLGAHITADIPDELYMTVRPVALSRAISNVIANARAHAEHIAVVVAMTDQALHIDVMDDGPGIPNHEIENVFKPFFRLDTARKVKDGGTGLGLTITQSLIQLHGGTITLSRAKPLGGLHVAIVLPR